MDEKRAEVDFSDISSRTVEFLGSTWDVIDPNKMNGDGPHPNEGDDLVEDDED